MKKNLFLSVMVTVFFAGVLFLTGCEKEELNDVSLNSIQKADQSQDPPRLIYQTHVVKEGGTPITFLGIRIGVGYSLVSKTHGTSYTADGNYEIRHTYITCQNGGNERCRIQGKSYAVNPDEDDDNGHTIDIDSLLSIVDTNIFAYADMMMDSVDTQLETGVSSGQLSSTSTFQTLTGETVTLRFDVIWTNGNTQGDADIELSVYYIE